MTILKIIPDFENKTAECIGYPSAGEHVDVRIIGAANLLPSSTLRFRVKFGHVTLALFPRPDVNETWETEGGDLKCHLNLNTIQARCVCRTGNTVCHAILDQVGDDEHTVEPTLFFDDLFDVTSWHREPGADEPYNLDLYPNQIADLNRRVNEIGGKINEAKAAAQAAQGSANAAHESAQAAVSAAQAANARANVAESAARGASASAASAGRAAQSAEEAAASVIGKQPVKQLPKYLHALSYDDTYIADARAWYAAHSGAVGGCSAISKDGVFGHKYDWKYSEAAEFVVRVSAKAGRHASVGVASLGAEFTEQMVCSGEYNALYRVLPGMTLDGINDAGVAACINVIPSNPERDPEQSETRNLHALEAVRYVLDNYNSALLAAQYIAANYYIPSGAYSYHWMIADAIGTYIVEDGAVIDTATTMTNHRVGVADDPYGTGYARRAILEGEGSVSELLAAVRFTNAYATGWPWPDEFAAPGVGTHDQNDLLRAWADTHVTPHLDPVTRKPAARDGTLWQSVHSAIYDLAAKTLSLAVQEDTTRFVFVVGSTGSASSVAWSDILDKPTWIGDTKPTYTAAEVSADAAGTAAGAVAAHNAATTAHADLFAGKLDDNTAEYVDGYTYDRGTFVRRNGETLMAVANETHVGWDPSDWVAVPNLTALLSAIKSVINERMLPSWYGNSQLLYLDSHKLTLYYTALELFHSGARVIDPTGDGHDFVVEGEFPTEVWCLRNSLQLSFPAWNKNTVYPAGSFVWFRSPYLYVSNTETTNKRPDDYPSLWTLLDTPEKIFGAANTALTNRVNALIEARIGDIEQALKHILGGN